MDLKTKSQIRAFQKEHGLVVDGIVGPQTRRVIEELEAKPSTTAQPEPDKSAINAGGFGPRSSPVVPSVMWQGEIPIADTARPISEIIFHCTATPRGKRFDRDDVNAWHKQRGWSMIGYHFLILLDGTIQIGRPIGMVGAHVQGHNAGTVGIAYVGGLSADGKKAEDTRTAMQVAAARWLIGALKAKFKVKRRAKGHNEYDKGKACPSFNMATDMLGQV